MAEMLVDSTKLDACLDAEADAIRAKTGDSNDLTFDFANNKGFADAIAAIPSGGGDGIGELIIDQTASEDVSTINLQIPSGKQNLDCYVVKLTGSLSANEWIYPVVNSNIPATNEGYFQQKQIYNNAFTIYPIGLNKIHYNYTTGNNSVSSLKTAPITNVLLCLYNAGSVFESGFNIKVYGVQLT